MCSDYYKSQILYTNCYIYRYTSMTECALDIAKYISGSSTGDTAILRDKRETKNL